MSISKFFLTFRLAQIRTLGKALEVCGRTDQGCRVIVWLRHRPWLNPLLRFLVGYRRTFVSFAEARQYAAHFQHVGHEHLDNIAHHSRQAEQLRESDYPLLFHLAPVAASLRRVFDYGGNVGNLFYSLQRELSFPDDLLWEVYDLPLMCNEGERLATRKNERRIHFTSHLSGASGCSLFIASGCIHYFEQPLAEIVASLCALPDRVVINRAACTRDAAEAPEVITVQDNRSYLVPCKIHNPAKLIQSLLALGYSLRATWPVYERHLWIPLYPEISSTHYRGFYFVKNNLGAVALPLRPADAGKSADRGAAAA